MSVLYWQLTDLTNPAGFIVSEPRLASNSAQDFLDFVVLLITSAVLLPGDYLIVDNAPIHFSEDIEEDLERVLDVSQVRLRCCLMHHSACATVRLFAGSTGVPAVLQPRTESSRASFRNGQGLDAATWPARSRGVVC
jgi:hypothetical protein